MSSPQLENGYIRIANEIWDEVIRRDFTKRQKDIIFLVWRLSYGCQKRAAYIPKLVYFELAGIRRNHIKEELLNLEKWNVLKWDREAKMFEVNKDLDQWNVPQTGGWDEVKLNELIAINLHESSQNRNKKFLKEEQKVPETGTKDSRNRNNLFPKQELSEEGENEKVPETGTQSSQNGNSKVPETGTSTAFNPLLGAASDLSKDIIKDNKDSSSTKLLYMNQDTEDSNGSRGSNFSFSRIYQIYEKHFTRDGRVTEFEVDDLQALFDDYGGEWCYEAMREAARHQVMTLAYVGAVLQGFKKRGGPAKDSPKQQDYNGPPQQIFEADPDDPITRLMLESDKLVLSRNATA
jgi:phage replication O-like protein O